jgi:hypothetical protein
MVKACSSVQWICPLVPQIKKIKKACLCKCQAKQNLASRPDLLESCMLCKWGLCTITVACKQHLLCYGIGGPSSGLVTSSSSICHLARSF